MKSSNAFIIAEAGVNHNGQLDLAFELIDTAKQAGADAVKFQTFKAEKIAVNNAPKACYQKQRTPASQTQFEMIKKLELDPTAYRRLMEYSQKKNIEFLSSPFDLDSIDLLNGLNLNIFKIPSGEIDNLPYLRKIGKLKKQIIISTGMADLGEIEDAIDVLVESGTDRSNIAILHCNTEYPSPLEDVNLRAMLTIQAAFPGVKVGYSDHTAGTEVSIAAVAMGAAVIEKHFTLDNNMDGPDHIASLEPNELQAMVSAIRHIEIALGSGIKKPSSSEQKNKTIARKSIVASGTILKGEIFTEQNITVKRPGDGISPMRWDEIIGKRADRHYSYNDKIYW